MTELRARVRVCARVYEPHKAVMPPWKREAAAKYFFFPDSNVITSIEHL